MTPQIAVWFFSLLGAILFFSAGIMLTRYRVGKESVKEEAAGKQELEALKRSLDSAGRRIDELTERNAGLESEISANQARLKEEKAKRNEVDAIRKTLEGECRKMADERDDALARASSNSARMKELERALTDSMTRFGAARRRLGLLEETVKALQAENNELVARYGIDEEDEARTVVIPARK